MAVAALSTSALALTAAPPPAAVASAQTPQAFADLVARARPDGKPSQDGAKPEGETDAAENGEDSPATTPGSEAKDPAPGTPADLLARIDALLAAAGRMGVGVPPPAASETIATATPGQAIAIELATAPSPTLGAATLLPSIKAASAVPDIPAPQAAPMASGLPASTPAEAPAAPSQPIAAAALPQADIDQAGAAPADATPVVRPAILQRGSDIAQLLASLRSAFASLDGKEAPEPTASAPVGTPPPQPVTAPPTQPALPPAAAVPSIAAAAAPVPVPNIAKASATAVTADISGEETASQPPSTAPAAPAVPGAPSVVAASPKSEPADAVPLPDLAVAAGPAPAANPPAEGNGVPAAPSIAAVETASPLPAAALSVTTPATSAPADSVAPAAAQIDQTVTRELDLVRDHQWLDRLARDISQAATRDGQIRFQLNPEHLGTLTVEIANSAAGTAIRMTAESDQARAIIADAQPRLLAEVRAQGLRVAESHVDLNQQGSGGSASAQSQQQQQDRQPSEDSKPFVRTQSASREDAGDSAPDGDGELYA